MSDPYNNSPRMGEPKKSGSMVYVIGGLIAAAVVVFLFMSGGVDRSQIAPSNSAPATNEAPATPATPAPAEPAPAAPAEPAPATQPATPPAANP